MKYGKLLDWWLDNCERDIMVGEGDFDMLVEKIQKEQREACAEVLDDYLCDDYESYQMHNAILNAGKGES